MAVKRIVGGESAALWPTVSKDITFILVCNNSLQWPHNEHDGLSNHQSHNCFPNRLFRRRSKKTSNLHVNGLCAANSPMTGEFPAQMASNAESFFIWGRRHVSGLTTWYLRYIEYHINNTNRSNILYNASPTIRCKLLPTGQYQFVP